MRAAWTHGKRVGDELICTGHGREACTGQDYINSQRTRLYDGDGFHVLSEYLIESQGFRLPESRVLMHPMVYEFCANWHGMRRKVPEKFEELNEAGRMSFQVWTDRPAEPSAAARPTASPAAA